MKKIENIIEESLKSEPSFKLSTNFADRVLKSIRRKERKSQRKLYVLMTLGIVVLMGLGFAILSYFQTLDALKGLESIVPLAVMIGGAIAVIQYLDNKLVKKKLFVQKLS